MDQLKRVYKFGIFTEYGEIQPDATAADLFHQAFQAPNTNSHDILEKVAMVTIDDIDIVGRALETSDPDCEAIHRVLLRMRDRLLIGVSLRKRFAEAEEGAEEGDATNVAEKVLSVFERGES